MIPSRQEAQELLYQYTETEALRKHAHQVEVVMEGFAKLFNEDPELWGILGLLHDLDYEKYPDQHCIKVEEILKDKGYDEAFIRSIQSHGYGICSDVDPKSLMEKTLYTIDELTGIINAACLVRPDKSIKDFKLKSLKKKYKDKKFAAGCDRSVIEKGIDMLPLDQDQVFTETIQALKDQAERAGLAGEEEAHV